MLDNLLETIMSAGPLPPQSASCWRADEDAVTDVAYRALVRQRVIPTAECFDRWYSHLRPLRRVVPEARLWRDAGRPAALIRAFGTSQSLVPLVSPEPQPNSPKVQEPSFPAGVQGQSPCVSEPPAANHPS